MPFAELLAEAKAANRALVMGVVNVTPDSFYDGGRYLNKSMLETRIDQLVQDGADVLDLGAESTRPGAAEVSAAEQIARLELALGAALACGLPVSVDTADPEVARYALGRGVHIVNDVSCLRRPELARVAAEFGAWFVLMHSRVPMAEMRGYSQWPDDDYQDIVEDVCRDWRAAYEQAMQLGVMGNKIIFDPGFAFSKNARHSYELLARFGEFARLGVPTLCGVSRKSFLTWGEPAGPSERLSGSLAGAVLCRLHGADILRVHDVRETRQALGVLRFTQEPHRARPAATSARVGQPALERSAPDRS